MYEESEHVRGQGLSLRLMVTISNTLAGLVQGMLGPSCQQTLLSTHTGKALVTRDGMTVLSSLHLSHPVARCMTDSLHSFYTVYCDGSKTFMLYLAELLKAVDSRIVTEGNGHSASFSRCNLSLELSKFLHEDFEEIIKLFIEKLKQYSSGYEKNDFVLEARAVLLTSLHTCMQRPMADFSAELLSTFLHLENQTPSTCKLYLPYLLQHFDMYHTKVSNQPQQNSRILQGILLETDLQPLLLTRTDGKNIRFLLVDIDFDGDTDGKQGVGNTVLINATSGKLTDLFSYKRTLCKSFISHLKSLSVDVLVSAVTAPQFVMGICKEDDIALRHLSPEKVYFLGEVMGVNVLKETIQDGLERSIFSASLSSIFNIGNKMCTLIEPDKESCRFPYVNHMVLCSPTEGLCDQLCQSTYKALKTLSLCLQCDCVESCSATEGVSSKISITDCASGGECMFKSAAPKQDRPRNMSAETSCCISGCSQNSMDKRDQAPEDQFSTRPAKALLTIKSGGAFEAVLSAVMMDYYTLKHTRQSGGIGSLIQEMIAAVPKTLHSNLSSFQHAEKRQFTEKWTRILAMVHGGCIVGLDEYGDVCSSAYSTYVEPVASKLSLVKNVLLLVIQLLRVEAVVPVKRPPYCLPSELNADDVHECDDFG